MNGFNYRGYLIKHEYGGWGVRAIMFDTKEEAKDWVDRQLDGEAVEL
jgi:hypothetical protein